MVGRLHGFASWGLGMLVGVASSVIVGVLYHLFIEKPLIRLFRLYINHVRSSSTKGVMMPINQDSTNV